MMGRLLCTLAFVFVSSVPGSVLSARPANLTRLLERLAVERSVHIAFSHMLTNPVVVRDSSSAGNGWRRCRTARAFPGSSRART